MCEEIRVFVADDKYEVVIDGHGHMRFLRYGESWPAADKAFCYSGLVYALAFELNEAREQLKERK